MSLNALDSGERLRKTPAKYSPNASNLSFGRDDLMDCSASTAISFKSIFWFGLGKGDADDCGFLRLRRSPHVDGISKSCDPKSHKTASSATEDA